MKNILILLLTFVTLTSQAQIHPMPSCPDATSKRFDWADMSWNNGELSNTITNIDGTGIDLTVTVSGATGNLSDDPEQPVANTDFTPLISDWGNTANAEQNLVASTTGLGNQSITFTYTFSEEVTNPAFTINHVNWAGGGGDAVTVTGRTSSGTQIMPTLNHDTSCADNSTTINGTTADAVSYELGANCDAVGVSFSGDVKTIIIEWQENTQSNGGYHALSLGGVDFCEALILPVKMVNYKAYRENETNVIAWETSNEINNDFFEIQRSTATDSKFVTIGRVEGNNREDQNIYEFVDSNVKNNGSYFYRIKQVDIDGQFEIFEILHVEVRDLTHSISFFPNPSVDYIYIKDINSDNTQSMQINIIDQTGKIRQSHQISEYKEMYKIDVSQLESGTFILSVKNNLDLVSAQRFIKL